MCTSDCTKETLPFHSLAASDLGTIQCMECTAFFSDKAMANEMNGRFREEGPYKLKELKKFSRHIGTKVRAYRRRGYRMAEAYYYIDPPINMDSHEDGLADGKHILRKPEAVDEDSDSPAGKVYTLSDFGSHEW